MVRNRKLRKIYYITLGFISLVVGLIGWILPIMHGTLFVVVGLLLLTSHSKMARNLVTRFMNRHPKIKCQYELWKGKAIAYGRRWVSSRHHKRGQAPDSDEK